MSQPLGDGFRRVGLPLVLFFATAASMVLTAAASAPVLVPAGEFPGFWQLIGLALSDETARTNAFAMAGSLLAILTAHEAGHYVAARLHDVPVSLPHFLPLPLLSPFGTMGAVIRMPAPVRSRLKLFDIGAAGPIAGLVVALPLYAYGISISTRMPRAEALGQGVELGSSLLSLGIEALFAPTGAANTELVLSPMAYGAWGGFLLTMLNLLPIAQLDGGHVATALFGDRWWHAACILHRLMLLVFVVLALGPGAWALGHGAAFTLLPHAGRATFWLVWSQFVGAIAGGGAGGGAGEGAGGDAGPRRRGVPVRVRIVVTVAIAYLGANSLVRASELWTALWLLGTAFLLVADIFTTGFFDSNLAHPRVSETELGPLRKVLAVCTLAIFAALLMAWPMSV